MTTQNYKPHIVTLVALFSLGNTVVFTPSFTIGNLILLPVLSAALLAAACFLKKYIDPIVFFVAIYGVATTFSDYVRFLKNVQMPNTSAALLAVGFALIVTVFAANKIHAIYKYSLFAFVIVSVIMLLCFVSGVKTFDYTLLREGFFDYSFSAKAFLRFCLPAVVIPFVNYDGNASKKRLIYGVTIALLMLFISMLQTALMLGCNHGEAYPYLKAVSVISVGSLYTRLDGLVWFLSFVTHLIKSVVFVKVIAHQIQRLKLSDNNIYKQKSL